MSTRTFTYIAVDTQGARQTGVVQGLSEGHAREQLAKRGLLVEFVREGTSESPERSTFVKHVAAPLVGRVGYEAQLSFFRQLASMHKAGVPLVQALDTLSQSSKHVKLRKVIADLRDTVLEGKMISEGMEKYPEVFSSLQVNLVRAGEQGGVLDHSLVHLNAYLQREVRLRNEIKSKTFYPKLLIAVAVLIIVGANMLITYFSSHTGGPQFLLESPLTNPKVLAWLIPTIVVLWLFFRYGPVNDRVRRNLHAFYIYIPYFGQTLHMLAMAKFGRAFSALYSGGVQIGKSIQLAADACGNDYLREKIYPSAQWIQEGRGIAESFDKTGAFTLVALDMASTGEHTGNLDAMFGHMAEQYEEEADVRLEKSTKVLSVVVLIIALVLVAYTVIRWYMNYFGIMLEQVNG